MTPEDSWVARWQRIGKSDDQILICYIVQNSVIILVRVGLEK